MFTYCVDFPVYFSLLIWNNMKLDEHHLIPLENLFIVLMLCIYFRHYSKCLFGISVY